MEATEDLKGYLGGLDNDVSNLLKKAVQDAEIDYCDFHCQALMTSMNYLELKWKSLRLSTG